MGKLAKVNKAFKKAKLKAGGKGGGGDSKGSSEFVHAILELGGSGLAMQASKNFGKLPLVKVHTDVLVGGLGVIGLLLAKKKKQKRYAIDAIKAGGHATLARFTYGQDKVQINVGKDGSVRMGEEQVVDPPINVKAKMRPTADGRPEVEVDISNRSEERAA